MKQVIRKPPVGHCSRHFHFKDGLSLLLGMIQKCLPHGDLSMAKLFFNCISILLIFLNIYFILWWYLCLCVANPQFFVRECGHKERSK